MLLTYFNDATQFIEEQLVIASCVQTLLYVAVQLIHHSLHIRILVL